MPLGLACRICTSLSASLPRGRLRVSASFAPRVRTMFRSSPSDEHLFSYTGGRWLWDEERQRRLRYRRFDVDALKRLAIEAAGAKTCNGIEKIAEGGSNRVFRLLLDTGPVIVRVPMVKEARTHMVMASEVATMEYARCILKLPVPKVFAWNGDDNNPAGISYMIMEEASGQQLSKSWHRLDLEAQTTIVEQIVGIANAMTSVRFASSGNLFLRSDSPCPHHEIRAASELPPSLQDELASRFVLGPSVASEFWEDGRAALDLDRGPWSHPSGFLRAIAECGMTSIAHSMGGCHVTDDPRTVLSLYHKYLQIVDSLCSRDPMLNESVVWHWDLRTQNIFVKGDKITSLIDWQDVWAGPLFLQVEHPPIVDYNGALLLKLPDNYESMVDKVAKQKVRDRVQRSILLYTFEAKIKRSKQVFRSLLDLPHGKTIRQTVHFAKNMQHRGSLALRQCLMRVQQNWSSIAGDGPCPISFSEAELEQHYADAEGWNTEAEFWEGLDGFVMSDGWTNNEDYEEALAFFEGLGEEGRVFLDYKKPNVSDWSCAPRK
ncbi:hypothetical protein KVT40_007797 [Elsinoe batatas]|uniref:Altered inheritance of mitochondria protein 9, mitochondrial n=1 Tax=Elsinoe batatas TaxID=2601811 RepID=A0A8K0KZH3_9PEZI|nr:hypothetical protein KVT40_007797 [Elsinoe batatas]